MSGGPYAEPGPAVTGEPADIVASLRAQLDEDETLARDAGGVRWVTAYGGSTVEVHQDDITNRENVFKYTVVFDEGSPSEGEATHIARHDPAQVLREVEAKRRIVDLCERAIGNPETYPYEARSLAEDVVLELAGVYPDPVTDCDDRSTDRAQSAPDPASEPNVIPKHAP